MICFTNRRNPTEHIYSIGAELLNAVSNIKDLGVMFDEKLTFDNHIGFVTSRAYKNLGFMNRITKEFRNEKCLKLLYNALVRSGLEYGSVIWSPFQQNKIARIEKVQRKFTRILAYKVPPVDRVVLVRESYPERLSRFALNSLEHRRIESDMCMMFKLLRNEIDINVSHKFNFRVSPVHTRHHQMFSMNRHRLDVGRYLNPFSRFQRTYNSKFMGIDVFAAVSFAIFRMAIRSILYVNA